MQNNRKYTHTPNYATINGRMLIMTSDSIMSEPSPLMERFLSIAIPDEYEMKKTLNYAKYIEQNQLVHMGS
jgi:hypothetical protein